MEMYRIDFDHPTPVYFIGIGGVSMSGLAEILMKKGFRVSGSDARRSRFTDRVEACGAAVALGQRRENVPEDAACAVYTAAIHPDNPEYLRCLELGIPLLSRAELLGQLMRRYESSVAVSGTHGKTSTTSMLAHILMEAGMDPTVSVGGVLPLIGGNIRAGGDRTMVLEACEYTNSFLSLCPTVEIILNIEADHLDFFKDIDDIRRSFRLFVEKLPEDGTLVIDNRIRDYREICSGFGGAVITVGEGDADMRAEHIVFDAQGCPSFTPVFRGEPGEPVQLRVPGGHNVYNALAALAAARCLGAPAEAGRSGLQAYGGAARRFERKGEFGGAAIVDDYAHHPQEIRATLAAAERCPHRELWCVFQPHTYSRTKALMGEFAEALSAADHVLLADIYAARESDTLGVSSAVLAERINAIREGSALYLPDFQHIENYLRECLSAGDLCITMGAGDIYKVGERLLAQ